MSDHSTVRAAYVYELIVDGVVRYVGKGTGSRATEHIRRSKLAIKRRALGQEVKLRTRMHQKIIDAIDLGMEITVTYLSRSLSDDKAYELEFSRIATYPIGQLWNFDAGGHGPSSQTMKKLMSTPEMRRKISEGTRKGLSDPKVREARRQTQIAAARTPESRKRKSDASKAKWKGPEYRNNVLTAQSKPEVRARMRKVAIERGIGFTTESSRNALAKRGPMIRNEKGRFVRSEFSSCQ